MHHALLANTPTARRARQQHRIYKDHHWLCEIYPTINRHNYGRITTYKLRDASPFPTAQFLRDMTDMAMYATQMVGGGSHWSCMHNRGLGLVTRQGVITTILYSVYQYTGHVRYTRCHCIVLPAQYTHPVVQCRPISESVCAGEPWRMVMPVLSHLPFWPLRWIIGIAWIGEQVFIQVGRWWELINV